jgi:hypothetical protein
MLSLASPLQDDVFTIMLGDDTLFECPCQSCNQQIINILRSELGRIQGPSFIMNSSRNDFVGLVLDPRYPSLWMAYAFVNENRHLDYLQLIGALVSLGHEYVGPEENLPLLTEDQVNAIQEHLHEQFRLHHPLLCLYHQLVSA